MKDHDRSTFCKITRYSVFVSSGSAVFVVTVRRFASARLELVHSTLSKLSEVAGRGMH